ncbi:CASP C terminal-domain-containing protein [Gymnopilus junonius]|uniref:Protein CASP n=1 Tax=Gymnopilus junonius TaxID=109634 RepID=A0A9P5TP22_GYMJU|nr:CASP C terminal-domain-containing protein [Gymnopilus junonius]
MASVETNFSAALATWKEVNLSELQKTLDKQGVELVDNQKESVVGRKALAEKTKEFKKIPDEEKHNAFKGLLKAYQTEIDNLTKRSKTSDNAFLHVYKVLAEVPDPYPLLEAAVDQTVKVTEAMEHEAELQRLRDENAELKMRINDFSSIENARKKAEMRTEQLEQKMDSLIQEKVSQKANELTATYDEKIRNYEDRFTTAVVAHKNQLRDLRASNETNQAKLIDHNQKQDQEAVAKLAEVDMIIADLEHANSRIVTLEHRNEILRAEIETTRSGTQTSDIVKALESRIADLESETEILSRSLDIQKQRTSEVEAAGQRKNATFQKNCRRGSDSEAEQLRTKLKQVSDYDEIKRELEIMKYVEFSGFDANDEGEEPTLNGHDLDLYLPSPNPGKSNSGEGRSLDILLSTKNKRLQEELTKLRILYGELEGSLQSSRQQLETLTTDLEREKQLNEKLEADLLSINKESGYGATDSETDILAKLDTGKRTDTPVRTTPIPFAPSADTSILPIVTSQRDRFRQRNAELEEELRNQFQIISELRSEVKTLQSDNLKLYEKVRYMQSYREESVSRPVTQLDPLPAPSSARPDDLSKYQARYEEAMNPFEAFRGREAIRAFQALNPVERSVLSLTRAILGNRRARAFFICYALALHILVMFTLYECGTGPSGTKLQIQPNPHDS